MDQPQPARRLAGWAAPRRCSVTIGPAFSHRLNPVRKHQPCQPRSAPRATRAKPASTPLWSDCYAALLSRAVGSTGKIWAFEPVARFRESSLWHLESNQLADQVEILDYGLSDTTTARDINLGNTSATFHLAGDDEPDTFECESVSLRRLDDVAAELGISRLDLIKSDIDGHEPFLFRGAEQTLRKHKPVLVLEVAEHCLQSAGTSAAELGKQLTDLGYVICSEATRSPYANQEAFLAECGSTDRSANILAVHPENVPGGISL